MATKPKSVLQRPKFDQDQLVALLPPSLGEWKLAGMSLPEESLITGPMPALTAEYTLGVKTVKVALMTDAPVGQTGSARMVQHLPHQDYQPHSAVVGLRNGLVISAISHLADAAALEQLLKSIDLAAAEKLVRLPK